MRNTLTFILIMAFQSYSQDSATTAYLENLHELTSEYDNTNNVDKHTEKPKPINKEEIPKKQELPKPTKEKTEKDWNEKKIENSKSETHFRELLKAIALLMVILPPIRLIFRIIKNQVK